MAISELWILAGLILAAAAIYSSVGHAGASGYLAAMALMGVAPATMKPTALVLNILVASFGTYRLYRAGLVNWRALAPLVVASVPLAFIGGAIQLPGHWYRTLVGVVLLVAAARLVVNPREPKTAKSGAAAPVPPLLPALVSGGAIGILSGLTGTGGGIFLSPLLIFLGWAGARQSAGLTAPFILVNSVAGLAGNLASVQSLPAEIPYLVIAAMLGALLGTQIGIRWFAPLALQRMLAVVLLIAAVKFIST